MRKAALLIPILLAGLLASSSVWAAPQPQSERRVALVMGNSAYASVAPLANPANDARLMAESLKALGFELVDGRALTDLPGKAEMEQAVQRFGEMVKGAAVGVFFYAGHGVQLDGHNYLVPVRANVSARTQVKYQLLDADYVLDEMAAAGTQVNVVVLDACRNNPFGERGLREVSAGLAQIMAPKGTLVAYSTAPGRTAADGRGRNSPFTSALARFIRTPGLRIDDVFMRVGAEVEQQTGGEQSPWKSDNLRGVFCLSGPCGGQPSGQAEQAKGQAVASAPGAGLAQYARPDPQAPLPLDPSWWVGTFRVGDARFSVDLDEKVKSKGAGQSFRVEFAFPENSGEMLANVVSRRKRDFSGFAGIEFNVLATRPLAFFLFLNTSNPANPKMVDRFYATFRAGTEWQAVRIPFASLAASPGWINRLAEKHGLSPGDQVLRLDRVEELRIGVGPKTNPPGPGGFWVDQIRFYK
ncbi:MAG: caspase family protein [Proteobacteria bacterium]|nr:caspase family protein [Pseudomonadota bacterium]MBU1595894.1 caspase family protein [Pseudomonadota bacterium]